MGVEVYPPLPTSWWEKNLQMVRENLINITGIVKSVKKFPLLFQTLSLIPLALLPFCGGAAIAV